MKRFNTILDAASYLYGNGFRYWDDYDQWRRGSWYAAIVLQKNGRVRVEYF
jgi:hypothetical protein